MTPHDDPYAKAWSRLRAGRIVAIAPFLAWLPVSGVLLHIMGRAVLFVTAPLAAACAFIGAGMIGWTRCPRCGEFFTTNINGGHYWLTKKCWRCGLVEGSTVTDAPPDKRQTVQSATAAAEQGDKADEAFGGTRAR